MFISMNPSALQFELVVRRGVDVQIINLTSKLEREAVKSLISAAIPWLAVAVPGEGGGDA